MKTTILVYTLFFGAICISLFRPWIGVAAGYLVALWVPQAIWPWAFGGTRVAFYISASTTIGFTFAAISGKIDFSALRSRQNFYILILWFCLVVSYLLSPIEATPSRYASTDDPNYLISNMSKVLFFYFIAILAIDTKKKLYLLVWVILFTAIHMIYWGNLEYFEGRMRGWHWTLIGPGYGLLYSVYIDENCFAMFYVMVIPFLYFMGAYYKNKALKLLLWLNIPFAWHCIFLTGSRGGMIGLSVVTIYIVIRSKLKLLSLVIPVALVLAFVFQGGEVMKTRGSSAVSVERDSSVQSRFESWEAGIKMMVDHPITGVGIGNFLRAYPQYADTTPYVAHNTIIQFGAESGVGAALMYLCLCSGILLTFFNHRKLEALNIDPFLLAVKESLTGSLAGFFVCALFLNLGTYELFYYILVLQAVQTRLTGDALKNINSNITQTELTL